MKRCISILIVMICFSKGFSQETIRSYPLFFGYYSHYVIQPGAKIGVSIPLKQWKNEEQTRPRLHRVFISPQTAVFARLDNHISAVANLDVGYKYASKHDFYLAPSVGVGYLISFQKVSSVVNLGTGGVAVEEREARHYFLPTINMEFGQEVLNRRFGWYFKLSYGGKISPTVENSGLIVLEAGLRIRVGRKSHQKSKEP